MKCIFDHLSGDEARQYWLPEGCYCFDDQEQFLCDYHALRAEVRGWEIYEIVYWGA